MISIITVAFNAKEQLNKTLESVLAQRCDNDVQFTGCECIVVDGGSTDGSAELLKVYEKKFEAAGIHFDARSEKDNGIYDGMNKGIRVPPEIGYIFLMQVMCCMIRVCFI